MGLYSIKDIAQLTSIKTHTIRMWEKRYGILSPRRNEANTRYYNESELTLLSNIAFLNKNGFKISKLAALSEQELISMSEKFNLDRTEEYSDLDRLIKAIYQFEEDVIEEMIYNSFEQIGIYETMLDLLLPASARLNLLMITGRIEQVHIGYYFNIIKKLFIAESSKIRIKKDMNAPHLVIFPYTSTKQFVTVAALNCCLKAKQINCTELGQDTPIEDLKIVYTQLKPDAFVTIISEQMSRPKYSKVVNEMAASIGNTPLFIIGTENGEQSLKFPANVKFFPDIKSLVTYAMTKFEVKHSLQTIFVP